MIISLQRRYAFVHILKTAGESVSAAFDPHLGWNDVVVGGTAYGDALERHVRPRFGFHKHATAAEMRAVVGADVWSGLYRFAFVRHPYPRAVSLYRYWKKSVARRSKRGLRGRLRDALGGGEKDPFWEWRSVKAAVGSRNFSEFVRHPDFLADESTRPQKVWVTDADGRSLVDTVGAFENLAEDFARITAEVGLPDVRLGRVNVSSKGPWWEQFRGEDDFEYLKDRYAADFEYFGYDSSLRRGDAGRPESDLFSATA